ncbi:MAG: hypothetical protein ABI376_08675 [Caulobacteraceae bacterium]
MTQRNLTRMSLVALFSFVCAGAAVAAPAGPPVSQVCQADFQKLCPDAKVVRGAVMRCVKVRLNDVSAECGAAVKAAQEKNAARKAAKLAAASPAAKGASQ